MDIFAWTNVGVSLFFSTFCPCQNVQGLLRRGRHGGGSQGLSKLAHPRQALPAGEGGHGGLGPILNDSFRRQGPPPYPPVPNFPLFSAKMWRNPSGFLTFDTKCEGILNGVKVSWTFSLDSYYIWPSSPYGDVVVVREIVL